MGNPLDRTKQEPVSPTSGVPGPWWGSKETRLRCRVVMPAPSAIWVGCMLALRRVSLGSPVFISSSVMVARLKEGCVGRRSGQWTQAVWRWSRTDPGSSQARALLSQASPAPCTCTTATEEQAQADISELLSTRSLCPCSPSLPTVPLEAETQGTSTWAGSAGGTGMECQGKNR